MKILKHPIFELCTCDKCMTVFQVDTNDELNIVFYDGVIQAWKIDCPVCRHRCNLKWAGIINPSDVTDTKDKAEVVRKIFEEIRDLIRFTMEPNSTTLYAKIEFEKLEALKKKYTEANHETRMD